MTLKFPNPPFVKEENGLLEVWLQGKDTENDSDVEIRVGATTLTRRYGANGLTNAELCRAFEEHRQKIDRTRAKFARRAKRAPHDAVIPDLSQTYLLEVSEETDIQAAVAAFALDPHVAYAPCRVCPAQLLDKSAV